MGDDSDIMDYDSRTTDLSNAALDVTQETSRISIV